MNRYLLAFLLKPAHGMDGSANGISSIPLASYYVPCDRGPTTEEDLENLKPGTFFVLEYIKTESGGYFREQGEAPRAMFGGCFIYAGGDSRFSDTYGRAPIHLHDRLE